MNEKTDNPQKKRGRPPLKIKPVKFSASMPIDLYQQLEKEAEQIGINTGCKPTIPALIRSILKKHYKC